MRRRTTRAGVVMIAAASAVAGVFAAAGVRAVAHAEPGAGGATSTGTSAPTSGTATAGPMVQELGGVRYTVLDARQGVTFRGVTWRAGMSPEEAARFDEPGREPTPYVAITLLIEAIAPSPGSEGASVNVRMVDPSWGWGMKPTGDGGRASPVLKHAFVSATASGGTVPWADASVRVPRVSGAAEVRSITTYGEPLPPGPATFTAEIRRGGVGGIAGDVVGTVRFVGVPLR